MSTTVDVTGQGPADMSPGALNAWFDERFRAKLEARERSATPRLSIMVTKGTLDWAYPPLIIGSTAAAMGYDVSLFFTFTGSPC